MTKLYNISVRGKEWYIKGILKLTKEKEKND